MSKLDPYLSQESKLEQDSRFKISGAPLIDYKELRTKRQGIRIYIFYIIIIFLLIFLIKSIVGDLTLFGVSGLNFFSLCNFPK